MRERDLISGEPNQGQPYRSATDGCHRRRKTKPDKETPKREGTKGCRFTRSTEEAGPEKPGDRAEEKTLRTGRTG